MSNNPSAENLLDHLSDVQSERTRSFDNVAEKVVQIASGLIAVTVTFRSSLLTSGNIVPGTQVLIYSTWIGLVVCVLFGLLSLLAKANAAGKYIKSAAAGTRQITKPDWILANAFYIMGISFFISISLFVAFAILNT